MWPAASEKDQINKKKPTLLKDFETNLITNTEEDSFHILIPSNTKLKRGSG